MPLSEHEERILAEIERGLSEEDPRFLHRSRRVTGPDQRARRVRLAVVAFALGVVSLLAITFHIALGFLGAALMFAGVLLGVSALQGDDRSGAFRQRVRRLFGGHDHAR